MLNTGVKAIADADILYSWTFRYFANMTANINER
jgi:hypothetical protein